GGNDRRLPNEAKLDRVGLLGQSSSLIALRVLLKTEQCRAYSSLIGDRIRTRSPVVFSITSLLFTAEAQFSWILRISRQVLIFGTTLRTLSARAMSCLRLWDRNGSAHDRGHVAQES